MGRDCMTPTTAAEQAKELVGTIVSAVERWSQKPLCFCGCKTIEEEKPVAWLEREVAQRFNAYARQQVEAALEKLANHTAKGFTGCVVCKYVSEAGHREDCLLAAAIRGEGRDARP